MKLSTRGRYAVTAMLDLALHQQQRPVTLADIALCQDISLSYLEQLFARLRRAGLVEGVRGPGGGYRLGRTADRITVADIIAAVDEPIDTTRCGGHQNCYNGDRCLTHELWSELNERIAEFLGGITLADLISRPAVQEVARRQALRHQRPDSSRDAA
jgi:Rrf2 family transcriptional regulator, iron-sulfur cluster assembly transcription factor